LNAEQRVKNFNTRGNQLPLYSLPAQWLFQLNTAWPAH
jgi:hypothetical protein